MKRIVAIVLSLVTVQLSMASCFGGFGLTRKLHGWNASLSNKWVNWIVFLILYIIPVYGIVLLIDVLILNSIEFWFGNRLVEADKFDSNGEYSYTEETADEKVVYTYRNYGEELRIDLYKAGNYQGNLVMFKKKPGAFFTQSKNKSITRLETVKQDFGDRINITVSEGDRVLKSESISRIEYLKLQDRSNKLYRQVMTY